MGAQRASEVLSDPIPNIAAPAMRRHGRRAVTTLLAVLVLAGCYEDRISLWGPTAGMATAREGGTVTIQEVEFPAGGSTIDVVSALDTAVGHRLLMLDEPATITFVPVPRLVDPRSGRPTAAGTITSPSTVIGPYDACTT